MTIGHGRNADRRSSLHLGRWQITAGVSLVAIGLLAWFAPTTPTADHSADPIIPLLSLPDGAVSTTLDTPTLVPGATSSQLIDLHDARPTHLTTTATRSSLLDTDSRNGLQMQIEDCNVAWKATSPNTYRCNGTESLLVSERPIIQHQMALPTSPGSIPRHLRVDIHLPSSADNRFQGLTSTIRWTFTPNAHQASDF